MATSGFADMNASHASMNFDMRNIDVANPMNAYYAHQSEQHWMRDRNNMQAYREYMYWQQVMHHVRQFYGQQTQQAAGPGMAYQIPGGMPQMVPSNLMGAMAPTPPASVSHPGASGVHSAAQGPTGFNHGSLEQRFQPTGTGRAEETTNSSAPWMTPAQTRTSTPTGARESRRARAASASPASRRDPRGGRSRSAGQEGD